MSQYHRSVRGLVREGWFEIDKNKDRKRTHWSDALGYEIHKVRTGSALNNSCSISVGYMGWRMAGFDRAECEAH